MALTTLKERVQQRAAMTASTEDIRHDSAEEETPAEEVPGGGTFTVDAHSAVVLQAPDKG